jgi:protein-S-isoprenylcysteine O-methyltransferase Ste14
MSPAIFIWPSYGLWLGLAVYLIVTGFSANRDVRTPLVQSLGLAAAIVAAFLLPRMSLFRFVNFAPINAWASSLGLAISVIGAVIFIWGRQSIGLNWSQGVSAKHDHELVTEGPYRIVRNPMYSGGIIAGIGSALASGGGFVFLLLFLTAIFIWRVGAEDRLMQRQFPGEYPAYRKRTKALIPFVW